MTSLKLSNHVAIILPCTSRHIFVQVPEITE